MADMLWFTLVTVFFGAVVVPTLLYYLTTNFRSDQKITLMRDPYPRLFVGERNLISNFADLVSEIIERWVLLKITLFGYWNRTSVNLKFVQALLVSSCLVKLLVYKGYLPKIDFRSMNIKEHPEMPIVLIAWATIFSTLFYNERNAYYQKWQYLADLYNEVLKARHVTLGSDTNLTDNFSYRNSLKCALVLDVVQMEMWSHPSFYQIFEEIIIEAYSLTQNSEFRNIQRLKQIEACSKLTKNGAIKIIEEYQEKILVFERNEFKTKAYRFDPRIVA